MNFQHYLFAQIYRTTSSHYRCARAVKRYILMEHQMYAIMLSMMRRFVGKNGQKRRHIARSNRLEEASLKSLRELPTLRSCEYEHSNYCNKVCSVYYWSYLWSTILLSIQNSCYENLDWWVDVATDFLKKTDILPYIWLFTLKLSSI